MKHRVYTRIYTISYEFRFMKLNQIQTDHVILFKFRQIFSFKPLKHLRLLAYTFIQGDLHMSY